MGAGHGVRFVGADNAQLARDGERRRRMVAGDHHGAYPGSSAFRHRDFRFLARRVDHSHQGQEHELRFQIGLRVVDDIRPIGQGQHT